MAKRKHSTNRPQPVHKNKGQASQFDKRARLGIPNPSRTKTQEAKIPLVGAILALVTQMASALDARMAFRMAIIMAGMMLADDRRVAAAWFAAAGVRDDWDRFYDCLMSIGRKTRWIAHPLAVKVLSKFDPGPNGHLTFALDDSPTGRFGKQVEGAGVHHNPTPGPADSEWVYGHNWVSLCLLASHPLWGIIALPLQSLLYVRQINIPKLQEKYGWTFQTKHQLAIQLIDWIVELVRSLGMTCGIWLVADGAYVSKKLLDNLTSQGVVVMSRLRKDSALFGLPPARTSGTRGRPRKYGEDRVDLSKRAAHRQGWESITYNCRGQQVRRQYKTFLATSRLVGGVLRVVIVRFDDGGWAAYFCTDCDVSVLDILETLGARWAIEEHFHDVKEVWGAGEQQVRSVWSNIGCWHLNQWMFTLVELECWDVDKSQLSDRSARPWDNASRRPSHADRRRSITKEMLEKTFLVGLAESPETDKFRRAIEDLISLSA